MRRTLLSAFLAMVAIVGPAGAVTRTWATVGGTNDWWDGANWTNGSVPQAGDDVVITNAATGVLLTNATPYLGSFTISNTATLVFSNWTTSLSATNVWLLARSTNTCMGPFTTDDGSSNRVHLICSNLFVAATAAISVNGRGFAGGTNSGSAGHGPGRGLASSQGGGHGGPGQTPVGAPGGAPYGDATAPTDPGSGGFGAGGAGGGAVRIDAAGMVTVNGTIGADGVGNVTGPGSGGSVYIQCRTFAGTSGVVSADGGSPFYSSPNGGGGGGRIAVVYAASAQTNLAVPGVRFSTSGGKRMNDYNNKFRGDVGTLALPDTAWLTNEMSHSGRLIIPGFTSWSVPSLAIGGWLRFPAEGFTLTVAGNVVVTGLHARLDLGDEPWTNRAVFNNYCNPSNGPTFAVGGDLTLGNYGQMGIYSGVSNPPPQDYGALVTVGGTLEIGAYSWVFPFSHPTDGGSVLFRVKDLTMISTNGGFNASGRGWPGGNNGDGYGPGRGTGASAGAGYGGLGLNGANAPSGATYGSAEEPVAPGSGGAFSSGRAGNGGGAIRIEASGLVTLNGTLSADATSDGSINAVCSSGGGSGGGIFVMARRLSGTNGLLRARGGSTTSSNTGVGGGGRIAVAYKYDLTGGAISNDVAGGVVIPQSRIAESGTVVWRRLPDSGTVIMLQ